MGSLSGVSRCVCCASPETVLLQGTLGKQHAILLHCILHSFEATARKLRPWLAMSQEALVTVLSIFRVVHMVIRRQLACGHRYRSLWLCLAPPIKPKGCLRHRPWNLPFSQPVFSAWKAWTFRECIHYFCVTVATVTDRSHEMENFLHSPRYCRTFVISVLGRALTEFPQCLKTRLEPVRWLSG